ncbi:hypothetical protein [Rubritalea sp.]|uniref:hypothetical protein n=1 Tax=Rubritalea sp. TaxID=2109375 RepID=UPI003242980F
MNEAKSIFTQKARSTQFQISNHIYKILTASLSSLGTPIGHSHHMSVFHTATEGVRRLKPSAVVLARLQVVFERIKRLRRTCTFQNSRSLNVPAMSNRLP